MGSITPLDSSEFRCNWHFALKILTKQRGICKITASTSTQPTLLFNLTQLKQLLAVVVAMVTGSKSFLSWPPCRNSRICHMSSRMCVTFLFGLQLKRPSQKNRILFFYPKKNSGFKNIYCNKKKKTKTLMSSVLNVIMKATTPPNLWVWYHFNLLNQNSYVTFHYSSIFWGFLL